MVGSSSSVERSAGGFFDQFAGQLDPLGLATRERGRRLAELHVVEPHGVERGQFVVDLGDVLEVVHRLLDVHLQHVGDRLALELHLSVSWLKRWPWHTGQVTQTSARKSISSLFEPLPFAGLAPPAGDVEAEPARLVPAAFRLGQLGVEVADVVEHLDVRRRVTPRRAADGRLVDGDHLVEVLQTLDRSCSPG